MKSQRRKPMRRRPRRQGSKSTQERLIRAFDHPLRAKIFGILEETTASPTDLSKQLKVPLSNVSYHVRVLEELGLIEATKEEMVRGALKTFYESSEPKVFAAPDWKKVDPKIRCAVSSKHIENLVETLVASVANGVLDRRPDRHVSTTALTLDEKGWVNVGDILAKAQAGIEKEKAAAAKRIEQSPGQEMFEAMAGLLFFEVSPETGE